MKLTKVRENFLYNLFYQLLTLVVPVITVPYISRILLADGIGTFSYTYSFASYFMLASLLGISNYGSRKIAKLRDDKKALSKEFISIYLIQIISTLTMAILYLISITFLIKDYQTIRYIELIYILSCLFDINWFYSGLEKFKLTVIRSTIIKILTLLSILLFVKNKSDIYIYVIIQSLSVFLTSISIFPFLKKYIFLKVKITKKDVLKHIKPCLILFVPVVAVSLYKIMDKIMLGALTSVEEVGFYEQAEKIVNIPLGIITALSVTLMPKISNLVEKKDSIRVKEYIYKSIKFVMFLSIPIAFGLIGTANNFIPIFLGNSFYESIYILYFLSFTIVFISFGNVIIQEYLIPSEKDKIFIYSSFIGAIINLVLNFILIGSFKSRGAAFSTLLAELFVLLYQIIMVRKDLDIKKYIKDIIPFFLKGIIMFIIVIAIGLLNINTFLKVVIQVTSGCLIYFLLNKDYIKDNINIRL